MIENPSHTAALMSDLQPYVVVTKSSLQCEEAECICLRHVKQKSGRVKGDNMLQNLGNGMQEGVLGETRDNGIIDLEERASALLTLPQFPLRPFSLPDVFRERHKKSRHTLGARNKRNVVAYPDKTAILAAILLLDLKLLSFSLQQLGDEGPVGFATLFMGNI